MFKPESNTPGDSCFMCDYAQGGGCISETERCPVWDADTPYYSVVMKEYIDVRDPEPTPDSPIL
jgi:hypothetical protein